MWIHFKLYSLFLLINSDIIAARSRVNHKPSICTKVESKKPDFNAVGKSTSEIKCLEYTWQAENQILKAKLQNRCNRIYGIAGGKSSEIEKYPHMAALGWETIEGTWSFLCGGSLISPNYVLTAAHCTKSPDRNLTTSRPRIVRMGVSNIYKTNSQLETPVDKNIRKIIVYPKYSSPKKYYDIALVEIDEVVNFTMYVHPACLYTGMDIINHPLDATGWGLTKKKKNSPVLQSAVLDIVHNNECKDVFYNRNWQGFEAHQSCAGKLDGSAGTCNGDSGAPLQYRLQNQSSVTNMNVIVGITSFGRKCGSQSQPLGVYVNVNYFIDWIESHVWPYNVKTLA